MSNYGIITINLYYRKKIKYYFKTVATTTRIIMSTIYSIMFYVCSHFIEVNTVQIRRRK